MTKFQQDIPKHRKSNIMAYVLSGSHGGGRWEDKTGFTVEETFLPNTGPVPSRDTWLVSTGTTEDNRYPGPQTGPRMALELMYEVHHSQLREKQGSFGDYLCRKISCPCAHCV